MYTEKKIYVCDKCKMRQTGRRSIMYGCHKCSYHICLHCIKRAKIAGKALHNQTSPQGSPQTSPHASPKGSPQSSPHNSPENTPKHSPYTYSNGTQSVGNTPNIYNHNMATNMHTSGSRLSGDKKKKTNWTIDLKSYDRTVIDHGQIPFVDILFGLVYVLITLLIYSFVKWIIVAMFFGAIVALLIYVYPKKLTLRRDN